MNARVATLLVTLLVLTMACVAPSGTPGPSATPGPVLALAEQRYALLAELGNLWYCDPDDFPVGRDPAIGAKAQFPGIQEDAETFEVILGHLGIAKAGTYSDAEQLAIYREWKVLNAIVLTDLGGGQARFDIRTTTNPAGATGTRTAGVIDERGKITIEQQAASGPPECPICLARGTRIDTPDGPRAVEDLRVGDAVWTLDADGQRIAAPIERVGSIEAPRSHRVVHLVLDDGREARISPRHPLADGRRLGAMRPGDELDGATIVSVDLVVYEGDRTFDVLPAGPTGTYWANGILVGSTLIR